MEIRNLKKGEIYAYDMNTHEVSIVPMLGIDTDVNELYKFGTKIVPIKRQEIEEEKGSAYVIYEHDKVTYVGCLVYDYFVSKDYVEGEIPIFFSKQNLIRFDNFVKRNRPFYNDNRSVYEIKGVSDMNTYDAHNIHVYVTPCSIKNINPNESFVYNTVDDAKNAMRFLVDRICSSYNKELQTENGDLKHKKTLLKGLKKHIVIARKFKAGHSYKVFTKGVYCKNGPILSFEVQSVDNDGIVHFTDGGIFLPKLHKDAFTVDITKGTELTDNAILDLCNQIVSLSHEIIRDRNYIKKLTKAIETIDIYNVENLLKETFCVKSEKEISEILKKYNKHIK